MYLVAPVGRISNEFVDSTTSLSLFSQSKAYFSNVPGTVGQDIHCFNEPEVSTRRTKIPATRA
jgi:hypothetical protein